MLTTLSILGFQSPGETTESLRLFEMLRLSWLLLGLAGVGILGVVMLALLRRAYLRGQRADRSSRPASGVEAADPWSEAARRLRVEPSPNRDGDQE